MDQIHILLATDGSGHSRIAETLLGKLPSAKGAQITVATAVAPPAMLMEPLWPAGSFVVEEQAQLVWNQLKENGRALVEETAARLRGSGLNAEGLLLDGAAGSALLDFAEREKVNLIVIGSRGLGSLKSLLLGSVARKLVNHASCSVLVARAHDGMDPEATCNQLDGNEKLAAVLAFDGSPGSQLALEWMKAQGPEAFRLIVTACAEPLEALAYEMDPKAFGETYRTDHQRATLLARQAGEALHGVGQKVTDEAQLARPAELLNEMAKTHEADLIVLSALRHGVIERFLIGSVSYEVATTAPCSVLVVR